MEQKRSGIIGASCVARNPLQSSQIRCKQTSIKQSNINDPFASSYCQVQRRNRSPDQYIHLVPDPAIVLFNEVQLNDMEQFVQLQIKLVYSALMLCLILDDSMSQCVLTKFQSS